MKAVKLTDEQVDKGPSYMQVRRYFWTAAERERIKLNRYALNLPKDQWTHDPIFQHYRFCNVYRELDKVTIWIRENWREPYKDHKNLAFAMAVARLINWPPSLEEIGFPDPWVPGTVRKILRHRKKSGHKVFTGAYLLGGGIPPGGDRINHMIDNVLNPLYKAWSALEYLPFVEDEGLVSPRNSLRQAWLWFKQHKGIGDFIAYEIVSDLRHTWYLENAYDIHTWANPGPGALRGLTRVWGHHPKTRRKNGFIFPKADAIAAMQLLLEKSKDRLPDWMPPWEMRDVEHWLCEFDKYERIRHGEGVLDRFKPLPADQWTDEPRLEI